MRNPPRSTGLLAAAAFATSLGCQAPVPNPHEDIQGVQSADSLDTFKAQLTEVFDLASKYAGYFDKAKKAVDFVKTALDFFDIAHFPSAELQAINALTVALNQFETDLTWYINTLDTADHLAELNADLSTMRQQVQQSQTDPTNQSLQFTTASNAYALSAEHLAVLEDDHHFLRKFRALNADIQLVIPASDRTEAEPTAIAEDPGGQWVYDWRSELPRLVLGVVARLAIIEAADPGTTLSAVRDELLSHYNKLLYHYNKIYAGVKCNYYDSIDLTPFRPNGTAIVLCADIYAGTFKEQGFRHGNIDTDHEACRICNPPGSPPGCPTHWDPVTQQQVFSYDQQCMANVDANWSTFWQNVYNNEALLRRQVLQGIPLFQLRALMNQIYKLLNPAPDLTEMQQRIPTKYSPELCLDVQGGNLSPGTPVWMLPCSGSGNGAQRWKYDRGEQTIVNTAGNLCMDAQLDSTNQRYQPILATCNGADSQRWSFDSSQAVLYNGMGSTTVLRGSTQAQDMPYIDWKDEAPGSGWPHSLDPFWGADTVNPCVTQRYLSSEVDSCVDQICAADDYCCNTEWDVYCVQEVSSVCGRSCPPQP